MARLPKASFSLAFNRVTCKQALDLSADAYRECIAREKSKPVPRNTANSFPSLHSFSRATMISFSFALFTCRYVAREFRLRVPTLSTARRTLNPSFLLDEVDNLIYLRLCNERHASRSISFGYDRIYVYTYIRVRSRFCNATRCTSERGSSVIIRGHGQIVHNICGIRRPMPLGTVFILS